MTTTHHTLGAAALGRTLPNSIEAEENLLSCCLLDGADVISRCLEARISTESFYEQKHGTIFEKMVELYNRQAPIEVSVVAEELKTERRLDAIGGYSFLTKVSARIPTTAQASYFIEKVREQALLREIIRTATKAVEGCYNFSGGIDEFVDDIERQMFAVTQTRISDRMQRAAQIVPDALAVIDSMVQRKGEKTGVCSGFTDLDQLTWGFQRADLIILAARPSMGKTALALNIAENISAPTKGAGSPVLVFSLEMTATQLVQRMLCSRSRVNMKLLRDGFLSRGGDEQLRLVNAADEMKRAPLFIDDSSTITVSTIRARARRVHARHPLAFIVVDYLQLMAPSKSDVPREQQVAEASRGLKALAKELNVPVMVLSQLNRAADKESRPPRLSDLRESGAIEQDADVVLLMARPAAAGDQFQVATDTTELIVAKQRNGPVGTIKLTFLRDITRFQNFHN
ncbi:MAG TPA: replicative DNA helicase [Candidatus Limnocylindrales bacterium]|nr:replicative DNA helicase [Candidatus Limnocylindrales bacterium]